MDEVRLPLERQQMREIGAQILKKFCDPENKVSYRNPSEIPSARQICLEVLHSKTGQKISRVKELLLEGANQVRPEICRIYSQKDVDFFLNTRGDIETYLKILNISGGKVLNLFLIFAIHAITSIIVTLQQYLLAEN